MRKLLILPSLWPGDRRDLFQGHSTFERESRVLGSGVKNLFFHFETTGILPPQIPKAVALPPRIRAVHATGAGGAELRAESGLGPRPRARVRGRGWKGSGKARGAGFGFVVRRWCRWTTSKVQEAPVMVSYSAWLPFVGPNPCMFFCVRLISDGPWRDQKRTTLASVKPSSIFRGAVLMNLGRHTCACWSIVVVSMYCIDLQRVRCKRGERNAVKLREIMVGTRLT